MDRLEYFVAYKVIDLSLCFSIRSTHETFLYRLHHDMYNSGMSTSGNFIALKTWWETFDMLARLASYFRSSQLASCLSLSDHKVYRNHRIKTCDLSVCILLHPYGRRIRTAAEKVMRNPGLSWRSSSSMILQRMIPLRLPRNSCNQTTPFSWSMTT